MTTPDAQPSLEQLLTTLLRTPYSTQRPMLFFVLMQRASWSIHGFAQATFRSISLPPGTHIPWLSTVTIESRDKVQALLAGEPTYPLQWRQVNHPKPSGDTPDDIDFAVSYCVAGSLDNGDRILLGRELGTTARLQQQLIEAQQTTEQDYWRLRHAQTHFRALLSASAEAFIVLDADGESVTEINDRARTLLAWQETQSKPRFSQLFDRRCHDTIAEHLTDARAKSTGSAIRVNLTANGQLIELTTRHLRDQAGGAYIVCLTPESGTQAGDLETSIDLHVGDQFFTYMPEAGVVTDLDGRVLRCNQAFVNVSQAAGMHEIEGAFLSRWLGGSEYNFALLISSIKKRGKLQRHSTILADEHGLTADVQVSAMLLAPSDRIGFTLTGLAQDNALSKDRSDLLPDPDDLTDLVGKVPLRELVRESTDAIERMSIMTALEITQGNRAAAAELLDISRQSLYTKMRRFNISNG